MEFRFFRGFDNYVDACKGLDLGLWVFDCVVAGMMADGEELEDETTLKNPAMANKTVLYKNTRLQWTPRTIKNSYFSLFNMVSAPD